MDQRDQMALGDLYDMQETFANEPMKLRSAYDGLGDFVSLATGTINDQASETKTEFADEADIHKILERYVGGALLPNRQIKYGETIDYSMGLQEALHAVGDAEAAYNQTVPAELRNTYPTWREWLNATANGSYEHELAQLAAKKAAAEPKPEPAEPVTENPPKEPPKG